jgi:hypothetical protein
MTQSGKGGLGTHKHRVSGTPGRNAKFKAQSLFGAKREEETAKAKAEKRKLKHGSLRELLKGR